MARASRGIVVVAVTLAGACGSGDPVDPGSPVVAEESDAVRARSLAPLDRADLCVTSGAVRETRPGRFFVDVPKMRAVAAWTTPPIAELRFVYRGPTAVTAPLGSGAIRRQLGLKLRAHDACNLVYVMWRIGPEPDLVVSVKHNPGLSRSSECGNHGYVNVRPRSAGELPPLTEGVPHVLRAELHGDTLQVVIDGAPVWLGELPPEALALDGPVGVRTDNARVDFGLYTIATGARPPFARCPEGGGGE